MAYIAIITGASSGLGVKFLEAVVNRYPQTDEYWILARRKERWNKLAGKYKNKKVVAIEVDLSNESSYDGRIKRLENEKPKVKVLINNAGYEKSGKFVDMRQEDILNMICVNIKGMTLIQRIILPYMQNGSYTIITCSVYSFAPDPNQTVYACPSVFDIANQASWMPAGTWNKVQIERIYYFIIKILRNKVVVFCFDCYYYERA